MNYVLLSGAGFSRNWGGWLANEAFEYLLGCPQIDAGIRRVLWKHRRAGGFEGALAELQTEYLQRRDSISEQNLRRLQDPIALMFADMDKAFVRTRFEFDNDLEFMVRSFLIRFDAIFTLNQDLLMERHYLDGNVALSSYRRWSGWQIPGMKPTMTGGTSADINTGKWIPDESTPTLNGSLQPFFKLHGSSNWTDASGRQLLVVGGNKSAIIEQFPILKWNHDQFNEFLSRPATRLMVIGYSFGDPHVNQAINTAAGRGSLKVFIIDSLGLDVIDENRHAPVYTPGILVNALKDHIIGASRRTLREIFGSDKVEHSKIMRFFS
jgi:SIR2-like domain